MVLLFLVPLSLILGVRIDSAVIDDVFCFVNRNIFWHTPVFEMAHVRIFPKTSSQYERFSDPDDNGCDREDYDDFSFISLT